MTTESQACGTREALAALRIDRKLINAAEHPRPNIAWIAAAAVLALLVIAVVWSLSIDRTAEVEVAHAVILGRQVTPTVPVLIGSGYVVTADRYISLGVRVPGRIESYLVEEGERVERGQPLVTLDRRPLEAALAEANAALAEARAQAELADKELRRNKELRALEIASQADLDIKQTRFEATRATTTRLEARVAQLDLDLEDTVLRAPTRGIVLEKLKEVSEIAMPGGFSGSGELIRLANTDELRAELDINESDLPKVVIDQQAEITPDAYPDRHYAARVVKLHPQINRQKGTLKVEVRILEPDTVLRPDMSARIALFGSGSPSNSAEPPQVLVPRDCLRRDEHGEYAWVVTENRVRRHAIKTAGTAADGRVVVTTGLSGGETMVIGEAEGLGDDQRIVVRMERF